MKRIAVFAAALVLAPLASAQLFKYVDKDGRTVYSDQAPANVDSKQIAAPSGPASGEKSAVERDKDLDKSRKEAKEKGDKADKAAAAAKENADRCAAAKQNVQTYTEGGRVYKYNDKGEREYMGDDEISAARQKAQREADEACKKA